jgi:pSer/pThr/pTyr-binding forkhead associated (FHA) protein
VVPKASPSILPFTEEDEKTTIESGWEEEGSTTVEQGEVAEKIRSLGSGIEPKRPPPNLNITHITNNTGSSILDEPTVDDQRMNAALSMITPPSVLARLIITQGNDSGQEIEVIPGKSYTIGRAIDNDVVLTDIAVSRKHFDLRHENGAWIVVDRGSGNGTLVNGNVEDQPFLLANGDTIEIGNTSFRFDNPNGVPRNAFADNSTNGFVESNVTTNGNAFEIEEEEPSTVAGKPLRDSRAVDAQPQQPMRPKTVPPPAPLPRPRPISRPPPNGANGGYGSLPAALQATLAPHQGMPALQHPAMLHAQNQGMRPMQHLPGSTLPMPHPQSRPLQPAMLNGGDLPNVMPTTIPGQGLPVQPQHPHMQGLPFTYPNVADHAQLARMHVAPNLPGRDAPTAHVPPTPYNGGMHALPVSYASTPTISRRTKLVLGGTALTLLAAIATIAIIKGSTSSTADPAKPSEGPVPKRPIVQSIEQKGAKTTAPRSTKPDSKATTEPPKTDAKTTAVKTDAKTTAVKTEPPKTDAKATVAVKTEPPKTEAPKTEPPKTDAKATVAIKTEPPKTEPPKTEPKKVDAKAEAKAAKLAAAAKAKAEAEAKAEAKKARQKKEREKEREKERATPPPKRVAAASEEDPRIKATELFRTKRFGDAASWLRASAAKKSGSDAIELTNLAVVYTTFGNSYNRGMAPQTPPSAAWDLLRSALTYDRAGVFKSEIDSKLTSIAPKAAMAFAAQKSFTKALAAAKVAEASGATGSATIVRSKAEEYAGELYATAVRELDANPKEAKRKLQEVKTLVPASSSLFGKANKQLAQINGS